MLNDNAHLLLPYINDKFQRKHFVFMHMEFDLGKLDLSDIRDLLLQNLLHFYYIFLLFQLLVLCMEAWIVYNRQTLINIRKRCVGFELRAADHKTVSAHGIR